MKSKGIGVRAAACQVTELEKVLPLSAYVPTKIPAGCEFLIPPTVHRGCGLYNDREVEFRIKVGSSTLRLNPGELAINSGEKTARWTEKLLPRVKVLTAEQCRAFPGLSGLRLKIR